jgi:twitching motility protein PilT
VLSIIQQREVGIDTDSYAAALKNIVRQDPDVIFVGEIRDADSALSAIQAAETGHLVISTLHTIDCMETINRVLDLFPANQQKEVRTSFAGALRGIVSQRLVQKADGKGRVPAVEILINTGRVFDRIVDPNTTEEIIDVIADGEYYGMQSFDQALVRLVKEGLVTVGDARRASTNPHDFDLALAGVMDRHASAGTADSSGLPF